MREGVPVWYHPVIDEPKRYPCVIDGDPWQLGHGAWVANLNPDDDTYAKDFNGRSRINAATVESLEDRRKKELTSAEWRKEGRTLFGNKTDDWLFVCPSCGHVAAVRDWNDAGAPEGAIAFSCVGRWAGAGDERTFGLRGGPCNYAGGGLFGLNPIAVVQGDGSKHNVFDFWRGSKPPKAKAEAGPKTEGGH